MFDEKFGFIPKKRVKYNGDKISIGSYVLPEFKIHCIYIRPFDFQKNELGSVYLSISGEDYNSNDLFAKNVFKYTKKQTAKVWELLKLLNVEIIEKENRTDKHEKTITIKREKQQSIIICSHCGSKDVQFMQNNRKNFSVGKAAVGVALTGGVGTLAGFAGKKGDNEFFCTSCNKKFTHKIK